MTYKFDSKKWRKRVDLGMAKAAAERAKAAAAKAKAPRRFFELECDMCGGQFEARWSKTKYCSPKCRNAARERDGYYKTCRECDENFVASGPATEYCSTCRPPSEPPSNVRSPRTYESTGTAGPSPSSVSPTSETHQHRLKLGACLCGRSWKGERFCPDCGKSFQETVAGQAIGLIFRR